MVVVIVVVGVVVIMVGAAVLAALAPMQSCKQLHARPQHVSHTNQLTSDIPLRNFFVVCTNDLRDPSDASFLFPTSSALIATWVQHTCGWQSVHMWKL